MTPKQRLQEAVGAMRGVTLMTAAQWEGCYPTFAAAINEGTFAPAHRDKWTARIEAMKTELQIRTAEYLLTLSPRRQP